MPEAATTPEVDALIAAGSPVACGISGGKDSCALAFAVKEYLDRAGHTGPRLLVHSDLGRIEWQDSLRTCERLAEATGLELVVVRRRAGDMVDRWLARWANNVERYQALSCVRLILPWSTPAMRFCTSELKVDVICRELVRRFPGATVLNAAGIRRDESDQRSRAPVARPQPKLTSRTHATSGLDWNAICEWTERDVWECLGRHGFEPHEAYTAYHASRVSCCYCLAGETEVVTRDGIKAIRELAGGRHQLLVPKQTPLGVSGHGSFVDVEVRTFGVQPLSRIVLRRGKIQKTIYATAEHRWLIRDWRPGKGDSRDNRDFRTRELTTAQLSLGDRLRPLVAHPPEKTGMVPFAVAQGFVFGDGSSGQGERPATLPIYKPEKDHAMLPFFPMHELKPMQHKGKRGTLIYGLPRHWKQLPDLRESRAFLLSWLAGYFAADGCVTPQGSARLDSASREAITFARSVAAICGVGYGPIRQRERSGFGRPATTLYQLFLDATTLPEWFFRIVSDRERILARGRGRTLYWTVESVRPTDREEEVFCATVPGVHAFGLADQIMTGNCIMSSLGDLTAAASCPENHDVYRELVALEIASTYAFQGSRWLGDVAPQLLSSETRWQLIEAKGRAKARELAESRIPKHLLYTKGWPTCLPSRHEAELLARVRREVAHAVGLEGVGFTDAASVIGRYEELMALKAEKEPRASILEFGSLGTEQLSLF
jgi:3'-phosphoadenosine 5'-phosphosulfate sulfotransferase (PAPS reductase)/FAD synthetase